MGFYWDLFSVEKKSEVEIWARARDMSGPWDYQYVGKYFDEIMGSESEAEKFLLEYANRYGVTKGYAIRYRDFRGVKDGEVTLWEKEMAELRKHLEAFYYSISPEVQYSTGKVKTRKCVCCGVNHRVKNLDSWYCPNCGNDMCRVALRKEEAKLNRRVELLRSKIVKYYEKERRKAKLRWMVLVEQPN